MKKEIQLTWGLAKGNIFLFIMNVKGFIFLFDFNFERRMIMKRLKKNSKLKFFWYTIYAQIS